MRRLFILLTLLCSCNTVFSGEITEKVWFDGGVERMGNKTRYAKLLVTYQHHNDPQGKVSCRVLDENSAVIAADSGNAVDFVARLTFKLKEKYRYQEVAVMCE